jgi:hypothetical protein
MVQEDHRLTGHSGPVLSLAYDELQHRLYTAGLDCSIKVGRHTHACTRLTPDSQHLQHLKSLSAWLFVLGSCSTWLCSASVHGAPSKQRLGPVACICTAVQQLLWPAPDCELASMRLGGMACTTRPSCKMPLPLPPAGVAAAGRHLPGHLGWPQQARGAAGPAGQVPVQRSRRRGQGVEHRDVQVSAGQHAAPACVWHAVVAVQPRSCQPLLHGCLELAHKTIHCCKATCF